MGELIVLGKNGRELGRFDETAGTEKLTKEWRELLKNVGDGQQVTRVVESSGIPTLTCEHPLVGQNAEFLLIDETAEYLGGANRNPDEDLEHLEGNLDVD